MGYAPILRLAEPLWAIIPSRYDLKGIEKADS